MRDYVGAGRPVDAARDLITRIRLIGRRRPGCGRIRPRASADTGARASTGRIERSVYAHGGTRRDAGDSGT